jgi:AraC-like DNA-binding protein
MIYSISSAELRAICEAAQQYGINPRSALRAAGVDTSLLLFQDGQVLFSVADTLLNNLAVVSNSDSFGLRAAEVWRVSDLRSLGLLLQHLPTLRDVLSATATHGIRFQTSYTEQLREAGDTFQIQIEVRAQPAGRQAVEYRLGTLFRMMQSVMGDQWRPLSVHTAFPRFEDRAAERRLFGDRMRFESAFTGMIGDSRDLDRPLRQREPEFERQALRLLEQHPRLDDGDVVQQVKDQILFRVQQNSATLPKIATAMSTTQRSLQRRLSSNGVEFTELLNSVRRDIAVKSLANRNISMSQITDRLGYSDVSTFGRWFKTQFHVAPAHWRDLRSVHPLGGETTR